MGGISKLYVSLHFIAPKVLALLRVTAPSGDGVPPVLPPPPLEKDGLKQLKAGDSI